MGEVKCGFFKTLDTEAMDKLACLAMVDNVFFAMVDVSKFVL